MTVQAGNANSQDARRVQMGLQTVLNQALTAAGAFANNARTVKLASGTVIVPPANATSRLPFADPKHRQSHVQTVFWTLARLA
jgi:hypothetical protein